jgi:hypothetical protein
MSDASPTRRPLPTGTVTFLRTDVEGSMQLARALGSGWDALNATHLEMIRGAVELDGVPSDRGRRDVRGLRRAGAAVSAAIEAQRALAACLWPQAGTCASGWGSHERGASCRRRLRQVRCQPGRADRGCRAREQIVLSETTRSLVNRRCRRGPRPRPGPPCAQGHPGSGHLFSSTSPGCASSRRSGSPGRPMGTCPTG